MNPWVRVLLDSVEEAVLISAIDVGISLAASLVLHFPALDALGLLLLLEAVALMLIGGAFELGGAASTKRLFSLLSGKRFEWSAEEHRQTQIRGAVFTLTGVLFFVEALAMALLTVG